MELKFGEGFASSKTEVLDGVDTVVGGPLRLSRRDGRQGENDKNYLAHESVYDAVAVAS